MNHLSEEQMTWMYYGDASDEQRAHLNDCSECRAEFEKLESLLEEARHYEVPERGEGYGREVWARLLPNLPEPKRRFQWTSWWTMVPAAAAMAFVAFIAGMLTQQHRQELAAIPRAAQERVLLLAMGDHLQRSAMVLAEIMNADPGAVDLTDERARAQDLLTENRLLRQAALRSGDGSNAALLDDLERTLTDIANSPAREDADDFRFLQRRIENEGLLLKVRVVGAKVEETGRRL